jgi:DNA ligase-1
MPDTQVMLASPAKMDKLQFPVLVSPKMDGIRGWMFERNVWSRSNKLIPNRHVQDVLGELEGIDGFDGELTAGVGADKNIFCKTTSAIMSRDGEPDFIYNVFDVLLDGIAQQPFRIRQMIMKGWEEKINTDMKYPVRIVDQVQCNSLDEIYDLEQMYIDQGYEGAMIRDPDAPYKFGRSTSKEGILLKLKRFVDSEAVILDAFELEHNFNDEELDAHGRIKRSSKKEGRVKAGMLGSLHCQDIHTGVITDVGTGFTAKQRVDLWAMALAGTLNGRIVSYKYFPTGGKDKYRIPSFRGFRDPIDL